MPDFSCSCCRFSGKLILACFFVLYAALCPAISGAEEPYSTFQNPRFILFIDQGKEAEGDNLHAPEIAQNALTLLDNMYDEYSRIFHAQPSRKVVLRFLSPSEFRRQTGAPSWTSAMYFRDEISIPISAKRGVRTEELHRALRHEYIHAIIAELSNYRVPAWLDEGVAQIFEGKPNPLLGPALRQWVERNRAIPLDWLQNGFTTLDSDIVPAAYAQSLFAAKKLVRASGFNAITKYLQELAAGRQEHDAFAAAFGIEQQAFEDQLTVEMRRWAKSDQQQP